jgi:hypothetical protein
MIQRSQKNKSAWIFHISSKPACMAQKGGSMTVIRWKFFSVNAGAGLCATCTWGTVRKGFRTKEEEIFCRMITPNGLVPFAVRECADYVDRRIAVIEPEPDVSRYGFVTKLSLGEIKLSLVKEAEK